MTKLSVNINKVALIRNSRGQNNPDILKFALSAESFGADGITVHPRPDERHIRFADLALLKNNITTELNVEGNPDERFTREVLKVKPAQVTLVPDAPGALTSDAGWNTRTHKQRLKDLCATFQDAGIRVSVFIDPQPEMALGALEVGADCIELYTESYARAFEKEEQEALGLLPDFVECGRIANEGGLRVHAGHDLTYQNLPLLVSHMPYLSEVSIGHALVSDCLYFGLEETMKKYTAALSYSMD